MSDTDRRIITAAYMAAGSLDVIVEHLDTIPHEDLKTYVRGIHSRLVQVLPKA